MISEDLLTKLIKLLFLEEIEGFLFDKPVAEYLSQKYSWRLTYYDLEDSPKYKNAFAFQKMKKGKLY